MPVGLHATVPCLLLEQYRVQQKWTITMNNEWAIKTVKIIYFLVLMRCSTKNNNKMTCAPRKDSDQPWHLPSLIRVFAICLKQVWILSYPIHAPWRLIRFGDCMPWLIWVFTGIAQVILLVLSCSGSIFYDWPTVTAFMTTSEFYDILILNVLPPTLNITIKSRAVKTLVRRQLLVKFMTLWE